MHQLLLIAALFGQEVHHPMGHLIIVGGGPMVPEISDRALALAGGKRAHVLIVPQASELSDSGQNSKEMWQKAGAQRVAILDLKDKVTALAAVAKADLICIPGRDQTHL